MKPTSNQVDPLTLKPHPCNASIYGEEDVTETSRTSEVASRKLKMVSSPWIYLWRKKKELVRGTKCEEPKCPYPKPLLLSMGILLPTSDVRLPI